MGIAKIEDYETEKGIRKILTLKRKEEDKWGFSFGVSKAKLILENIDEIKSFVSEFGGD